MGIIKFVDRIKSILWQNDKAIEWDRQAGPGVKQLTLLDSLRGIDSISRTASKKIIIVEKPKGKDKFGNARISLIIKDHSGAF